MYSAKLTLALQTCLFLEIVIASVDNKQNVDTICFDFTKAFDKISHQRYC